MDLTRDQYALVGTAAGPPVTTGSAIKAATVSGFASSIAWRSSASTRSSASSCAQVRKVSRKSDGGGRKIVPGTGCPIRDRQTESPVTDVAPIDAPWYSP